MLTYTFEDKGDKPYYQYIYECIKRDIDAGVIAKGERLPSKRAFSRQLGVSVLTIANAYEQLLVEGYLTSVEKKGYFAAGAQIVPAMPAERKKESDSILKENERRFLNGEIERSTYRVDFTSNQIDCNRFPMSTWSHLMREVLSTQSEKVLAAAPAEGVYELRKAIAAYLVHFRGMRVMPHQIIIGAGTEYLYQLLIQLLGHHLIYGIENPGYRKLTQIYEKNNVLCKSILLDEEGLSVEKLRESDVSVIHTSPTHHFPTGIVMPITRRRELLAWAEEGEDRYIIEDDYDCEFRFGGLPIPTLESIDEKERVIYLNTFSKSLTPSIRISYMILPPHLLKKFRAELGFYACTVSNFEQYVLASFIEQGYFEKHINRMRNFYRKHRNAVIAALEESSLSSYATVLEEDAGLHFLLQIRTNREDQAICKELACRGIRLRCMADYAEHASDVKPHTFIINYTSLPIEGLREVFDEIAEVCMKNE